VFFYVLKSHKIAIIFKLKDIYLQREKRAVFHIKFLEN